MLKYIYDKERYTITENRHDKDIEIRFKLNEPDDSVVQRFRLIRDYFDRNEVHTDVLYYPHRNQDYQWIIRNDYYTDFILALFKYRLLESVSWEAENKR
ncbi:hypothetical protein DVH26_12000 [Paenibacillus sp. H1-7]|uniref:hypothetical protein n=1 Tax=Paenibacillus sp. H1-7 TaxID=2282849 RepID=UPI001EF7D034|nr:hypothetical protein [Paenibacillus sp. H1-7]ULL15095.1 hypothetical protein DVH26_12000 [Paenibacillus sp. H1-7]